MGLLQNKIPAKKFALMRSEGQNQVFRVMASMVSQVVFSPENIRSVRKGCYGFKPKSSLSGQKL